MTIYYFALDFILHSITMMVLGYYALYSDPQMILRHSTLRWDVMALTVLTSTGRLPLLYIPKHDVISLLFIRHYSAGTSMLLYITKTSLYFCYIFLRNDHYRNTVGQDQEFWMMWKNDTSINEAMDTIIHCLYGWCTGTRKGEQYFQGNNVQKNDGQRFHCNLHVVNFCLYK
jgi:hypothetical protein